MNGPTHDPADVVTGIMLQITQHAERLALLDQREAGHCREMTDRLDELVQQLAETREQVDAIHDLAARQAALLETLNGLDQQVSALATRLTQMTAAGSRNEDGETYQPASAPRWWKLDGSERDEAVNRLRAWVEQIYRPGYGHLAAALGTCWDQHPLCLYGRLAYGTLVSPLPGRRTQHFNPRQPSRMASPHSSLPQPTAPRRNHPL
jgi:hypothetical protein